MQLVHLTRHRVQGPGTRRADRRWEQHRSGAVAGEADGETGFRNASLGMRRHRRGALLGARQILNLSRTASMRPHHGDLMARDGYWAVGKPYLIWAKSRA